MYCIQYICTFYPAIIYRKTMENSKFFTLLRTLNADELPAFHKYLRQLHGGEKIALQVFEYARKSGPDFKDEKKLDIEYAYQKIFKEELSTTNRKKMLDALSDLHLWLKDFLLTKMMTPDFVGTQIVWLDILQERGLHEDYSKQLSRFYAKVKEEPKKDTKKYLVEMTAGYSYYQQLALIKSPDKITDLQACLDSLEVCAETIRMRLACQLANVKKVLASKSAPAAPPLRLPEDRIRASSPLLELSCNIYQLIETEEEKYYNEIEKVFKANQLDPDELHGALGYLHNYAATQIRNGKENNIEKIHELNQLGLKNGLFKDSTNLSPDQFNNIISIACSAKDYAWATSFIRDRQMVLPEDIRDHIVLLARATVNFSQGNFEQVLTSLDSIDFTGLFNNIRCKLLMLMSYVELDKDNAFEYCQKFETWLIHREPKTSAVAGVLATVRIIKMLISKKEQKEIIQNRIDLASNLYSKTWLQKKTDTYKARYATRDRRY